MGIVHAFPRPFPHRVALTAAPGPLRPPAPVTRLPKAYRPLPNHEQIMAELRRKHSLEPQPFTFVPADRKT